MFEKLVEHEGELESSVYCVAYKLGVDNSDPSCTVVMLAFQLGYDIKKFPENVMISKIFRRLADEIEGGKLTAAKEEESPEQQGLPLSYEDEGENSDRPTTR